MREKYYMSDEKNRFEANRWLKTARYDLDTAQILLENKRYAHCCFLSQQSAEKALKSIYYFLDEEGWGHSVLKLIDDMLSLDEKLYSRFEPFKEEAVVLDKFYIPTRYPNGLPEITPDVAFTEKEAREGITIAQNILELAESVVNDL